MLQNLNMHSLHPADSAKMSKALLTQREHECLQWIAKGKTAKEIAIILHLSPKTIESHIGNIRLKLNSANITQAVYIAAKMRLI